MAVLPDADRADVALRWVRRVYGELNATATCDHPAVRAAVDAADVWADANAAAFNAALPLPFRTAATTDQKTALLCYVVLKRSGIL